MSKSIVIIGRGHSVTKSTKQFIDLHDEVCIINQLFYNNYKHLISDHADYIFGNRTSFRYSQEMVDMLGLKEMIFTGKSDQKFDRVNNKLKINYPNPNLRDIMMEKYGFDPSSGIQALYYFLDIGKYNQISIVGFDFYEVGSIPYYFKPSEADNEQKYLWGSTYKDNKINIPSGHDTTISIDYLIDVITENPSINFKIITHSNRIKEIEKDNLEIIK